MSLGPTAAKPCSLVGQNRFGFDILPILVDYHVYKLVEESIRYKLESFVARAYTRLSHRLYLIICARSELIFPLSKGNCILENPILLSPLVRACKWTRVSINKPARHDPAVVTELVHRAWPEDTDNQGWV